MRISLPDRGGDKDFEFDRLFSTKDGQEAVFDEVGVGCGGDRTGGDLRGILKDGATEAAL